MQIMKKIAARAKAPWDHPLPVIAFLGDSVTQGCFEIYLKNDGDIETVYDHSATYHTYLAQTLAHLFPKVPVTIINAGISGDRATKGVLRLERDVLRHKPDLTVVSYGLNDCDGEIEGLDSYAEALEIIFSRLTESGSEVIFLTENMMNTELSCHLPEIPLFREIAQSCMNTQNSGILKTYFEVGKEVALRCGVRVCDVYAIWEQLAANGVDTTALLSNNINHPTREMNRLFADSLLRVMLDV